jgi:hypothetical protein
MISRVNCTQDNNLNLLRQLVDVWDSNIRIEPINDTEIVSLLADLNRSIRRAREILAQQR